MFFPKVTIGIATKNRIKNLEVCITSLLKLDYPNFEIKIFCDGCTDNTIDALRKYDGIKIIINEESIGYKKARNILMSGKDFKYFVTLDDDTYFLHTDTLKRSIEFLEKNENIGILSFDIRNVDYQSTLHLSNCESAPFQISEFIGCGNIIRNTILVDCGFYNENILPYGLEEQELSINCLKWNYLIYYLPGAILIHNEEQNNRSYSRQWRSTVNNILYISYTYYPKNIWPLFLLLKILILLKYGLINGKLISTMQGIFNFCFRQEKKLPKYYFGRLSKYEFYLFHNLKRIENIKKRKILAFA